MGEWNSQPDIEAELQAEMVSHLRARISRLELLLAELLLKNQQLRFSLDQRNGAPQSSREHKPGSLFATIGSGHATADGTSW